MKQKFLYASLMTILLTMAGFTKLQAQSWWKEYLRDSSYLEEVLPTNDGNFMVLGSYNNTTGGAGFPVARYAVKVNQRGIILSQQITKARFLLPKTIPLLNNNYVELAIGSLDPAIGTDIRFFVTQLDSSGGFRRIDSISGMSLSSYANYVRRNDTTIATVGTMGFRAGTEYPRLDLYIFNPLNRTLMSKRYIDSGGLCGLEMLSYGYVCYYSRYDTVFRVAMSWNGDILDRKFTPKVGYFGNLQTKIYKDKSENIFLMKYDSLYKFKNSGQLDWKKSLNRVFVKDSNTYKTSNVDLKILPNGELIIVQSNVNQLNNNKGISLYKLKPSGDSLWVRAINFYSGTLTARSVALTEDGGFLIGATGKIIVKSNGQGFSGAQLIKTNANGETVVFGSTIKGQIRKNDDGNCQIDASDTPLPRFLVEATNTEGGIFRGLTDKYGHYNLLCDTGDYTVQAIAPNNLWAACLDYVPRRIPKLGTTDTIDFSLTPNPECTYLTVDLSTFGLRRCFDNSIYVNYCNSGSAAATNAYVMIRLDSLIELTNATRPVASQNRNVFRFNLGTIGIGECGNFSISGRVRCGDSTRLGQTLCNEAHIYPDSTCTPINTFSGANLTISGGCAGDSVLFIVKNVGTATSQSTRSVVIEDEVLFMRNNINSLPPNATFSKKYKSNGSTWRMTVEQEPNHPTSQFPTAFVEGCGKNSNGGTSTGFATAFGNDDAAASISTLCRPIVGSFDPNDKQGFPTGYKTEHFIRQNQDLDYMIRFQNTGTDTAFLVVIRDTLSDVLDISRLEFGAGSHPYETDIYGKNIVKFTFKNINLPDSFKNVAASQGFVKFRIKQKKDLPIGTKINNKAGIYFDYNDPIITNTTLHTVAKDILITAIIEPNNIYKFLTINVSPNPFTENALFELLESDKPFNAEERSTKFELYDPLGRLLRSEKISNYRFDFSRKDLMNGLYFFKITDNGKVVGNGKLMIR
jgi:hypothetical protein